MLWSGGNKNMMDNCFTAGIARKLQFTHNLVESHVNILIIMICYDLKNKC